MVTAVKIRMLEADRLTLAGEPVSKGAIAELGDDMGRRLISAGFAKEVKPSTAASTKRAAKKARQKAGSGR